MEARVHVSLARGQFQPQPDIPLFPSYYKRIISFCVAQVLFMWNRIVWLPLRRGRQARPKVNADFVVYLYVV